MEGNERYKKYIEYLNSRRLIDDLHSLTSISRTTNYEWLRTQINEVVKNGQEIIKTEKKFVLGSISDQEYADIMRVLPSDELKKRKIEYPQKMKDLAKKNNSFKEFARKGIIDSYSDMLKMKG